MTDRTAHWDTAYGARGEAGVSWFDAEAARSFDIILPLVTPGDPILDVGGGASRLVDRLLDAGLGPVDVLDLSPAALGLARARLGPRAGDAGWIVADVTDWSPARAYALWHDRAAFHFLTDPADRRAYAATLAVALRPDGHAVISTFAEDGPTKCSGLPVVRYAPKDLVAAFEVDIPGALIPVSSSRHIHTTPGGAQQRFQTTVLRRAAH
jgi:SAM-dependent methyltransferase